MRVPHSVRRSFRQLLGSAGPLPVPPSMLFGSPRLHQTPASIRTQNHVTTQPDAHALTARPARAAPGRLAWPRAGDQRGPPRSRSGWGPAWRLPGRGGRVRHHTSVVAQPFAPEPAAARAHRRVRVPVPRTGVVPLGGVDEDSAALAARARGQAALQLAVHAARLAGAGTRGWGRHV